MKFLQRRFIGKLQQKDLTLGLLPITQTTRDVYSRLCERIPLRCRMLIVFTDPRRGQVSLPARSLNMSGSGALVKTSEPIEEGTMVYVRGKDINFLAGGARVRHCTWSGFKYRIGLEFHTTLG